MTSEKVCYITISTEARGVVEKYLRPLDCARGGVEVVLEVGENCTRGGVKVALEVGKCTLEVETRTYNNKYIAYKSVRCTLNAKR